MGVSAQRFVPSDFAWIVGAIRTRGSVAAGIAAMGPVAGGVRWSRFARGASWI